MFCGYCGKENAEDHSFCTGCGKPLESGTPNQPIQPEDMYENPTVISQENQETESSEDSRPQSKYLSVTWWKDSPWPWQARSLDGRTLLGSYETEVKAADVVAKLHKIDRIDLLMITGDSEQKEKLLHKLRKRKTDEQGKTKATKKPEISKPEVSMKGNISSPAPSEIKEHCEAPAVRKSVETKTSYPDRKFKQIESSNSASKVILWVVVAFFGAVTLSTMWSTSEGKQRLWNAAEGAIIGLIFTGLFWLLGAIIKSITGKEIRTGTGYIVAIGFGFATRHALIVMLAGQP